MVTAGSIYQFSRSGSYAILLSRLNKSETKSGEYEWKFADVGVDGENILFRHKMPLPEGFISTFKEVEDENIIKLVVKLLFENNSRF